MTQGRTALFGAFLRGRALRSIPWALFPLALASACSGMQGMQEKTGISGCANLSVLIDAELADDEDWRALCVRRKKAQTRADELAAGAEMLPADRNLFRELEDMARQESRLKKKVYPRIFSAVKTAAKRRKIDFVLSMDDGLLYADSRYDITGEVLQELKTIRARSDPLVR